MSCARTRTSVGPPRWTWRSTCSTACWSWDARTTSASPDPKRGWGQCAHSPDPCNTLGDAGNFCRCLISPDLLHGDDHTVRDLAVAVLGLYGRALRGEPFRLLSDPADLRC